jgi:ribonuclease Z
VKELGFQVGPWLRELKEAALRDDPDDSLFRVWWRKGGRMEERLIPLGTLKKEVLRFAPGRKISYVVDAVYHDDNRQKILELAQGSDILFIEAAFLQEDAQKAAQKFHLTAHQAGLLAGLAGAKRLIIFHFSPKYTRQPERLWTEAEEAFFSCPDSH